MAPALTMAVLAPAKINLSLRVIGRRADGYHLLQSLMVPVSLYDEVRLTVTHGDAGRIQLLCDAPGVPCGEDNLVCQAARLFLARTGWRLGCGSIFSSKSRPAAVWEGAAAMRQPP